MPYGETIADYIRSRQARRSGERDARWSKLMDAASMGADIWKTLSGRKFTTSERLGGEQFADLQGGKSRDHAVSMQEDSQLYGTGERLGSEAFSKAESALDRAARLAETRAGQKSNEEELNRRLNEALDLVTKLRADWTMPDPNNPALSVLDLSKAAEIKEAVLAYFPNVAERNWAEGMLNKTIATWKPPVPKPLTQGGGVDYLPMLRAVADKAKNIIPPAYDTGGITTKSWAVPESQLEAELASIIPQLQGEDQALANAALNMSKNPGKLGSDNYAMLYRVTQVLKSKLAPMGSKAPNMRSSSRPGG